MKHQESITGPQLTHVPQQVTMADARYLHDLQDPHLPRARPSSRAASQGSSASPCPAAVCAMCHGIAWGWPGAGDDLELWLVVGDWMVGGEWWVIGGWWMLVANHELSRVDSNSSIPAVRSCFRELVEL